MAQNRKEHALLKECFCFVLVLLKFDFASVAVDSLNMNQSGSLWISVTL